MNPFGAERPCREVLTDGGGVGNHQPREAEQEQVPNAAPGMRQPSIDVQPGDKRQEGSPTERDLGVMADSNLDLSQQCALAARRATHSPGCTRPSTAPRQEEGLSALFCAVRPHLHHWVRVWPHYIKRASNYSRASRGGLQ